MQLKTSCPNCNAFLSLHSKFAGQSASCPKCQIDFIVTELPTSASDPEATMIAAEPSVAIGNSTTVTFQGASLDAALPIVQMGKYQIRGTLGRGGFGLVYKAFDPQLERLLALKVPTFGPEDVDKAKRFRDEAKAAAQLRHPNIVPVYESGKIEDRYYIASQFIDGEPLSAVIKAGAVDLRDAAAWCAKIADALAYAHTMKIVHRDVKPQNVMLDDRGEPQLMDFGLAKRLDDEAGMTGDGTMLGTPAYMAPEQAKGHVKQIGPHTDQYALGVTLYELLTGRRPFVGEPLMVLHQIVYADPPPLSRVNEKIPRDLEAITQKAMSKEISGRYADCRDLASDLQHWLAGEPTLARPISAWERLTRWARRNRSLAFAFAATAAALLLVAVLGVSLASYFSYATRQIQLEQQNTKTALKDVTTERDRAEEQTTLAEERLEEAQANAYVTTFRLAESRWREGDGDKTVALLEQLRPKAGEKDRRGWEWNYLWNQSHSHLAHFGTAEIAALGIKGEGLVKLPLAPDGKSLIHLSNYEIVVADLSTGAAKWRIRSDDKSNYFLFGRFSPDGRWVFTGNSRDELICWDANTGTQRYLSKSPRTGDFRDIDFSADGQRMFTYASPRDSIRGSLVGLQVEEWNPENGTSLNSFDLWYPIDGRAGVRISPDGNCLAVGVQLFDTRTGALLRRLQQTFPPIHDDHLYFDSYGFSPDGRSVAYLNAHGLAVFEVESGKEQLAIPAARPGNLNSRNPRTAWSSDGARIATYSEEGIKVWNAASGERQLTIRGVSNALTVAFSPDGRSIITGHRDGSVAVWDAATGENDFQLELTWPNANHYSAGLRAADNQLRVISSLNGPTVLDLASGETLMRYQRTEQSDPAAANQTFFDMSPDGSRAYAYEWRDGANVVGEGSQKLVAWDVAAGTAAYSVPAPGAWFGHPQNSHMSADGNYLATTDAKYSKTYVWNLANGALLQAWTAGLSKPLAIDATGASVVTGGGMWDIQAHRELYSLNLSRRGGNYWEEPVAAFSQDGSRIAIVNQSSSVRILDAATGKELQVFREKLSDISQVAFSPDRRRLLTATRAGTTQLWDLDTNQELVKLTPNLRVDFPHTTVAMSPDGSRIFCLYSDTNAGTNEALAKYTCVVWDGRPESESKTRVAERAARSTVAYFRGKTNSRDELVAAIRNDTTISEATRALAVEFASLPPVKIFAWQRELSSGKWSDEEAFRLVETLFKTHLRSQVIQTIEADQSISESVRSNAIELAKHWQISAQDLLTRIASLPVTEKIAALEDAVRVNERFDYSIYHTLRHHYLEIDEEKSLSLCDVIFRHHPMDGYTLQTLTTWVDDRQKIIEDLLRWPEKYPQFKFVSAACWLRVAQLQPNHQARASFLKKVEALEGQEFEAYRKLGDVARAGLCLRKAFDAYRANDSEQLTDALAEAKCDYPDDALLHRKIEHLQKLLNPSPLVKLSELEPSVKSVMLADVEFKEMTMGWEQAFRNRSAFGADNNVLLEVKGAFFESGLWAHAPARHVVRLDRGWKKFTTQYGIRDNPSYTSVAKEESIHGSVVFVVRGDGIELFRSELMSVGKIGELTIPVADCIELELVVEEGGNGGYGDWGLWLSPQLIR